MQGMEACNQCGWLRLSDLLIFRVEVEEMADLFVGLLVKVLLLFLYLVDWDL